MSAINLTEATFEETINSEGILLIDWWAEWCGPCKQFAPIFESAAEKHQDITFAKIDTEAEQNLAGAVGITSIPTLMAFRDGILLYAQPGALPAEALDQIIEQVQALDMDKVRAEVAAEETQAEG
ncbi:MAG: thioredoxin [Actinomycetales bacterium]|nr:thioredoxin [Actinomycetales bacterium]